MWVGTSGLVDSQTVLKAARCCWLLVPSILTQESLTAAEVDRKLVSEILVSVRKETNKFIAD